MGLSAGLAMKIAKARATAGGTNIRDGIYVFEVLKLIAQENRKKEWMFIIELIVRQATAVSERDAKGNPIDPNPVGSTCSYVVNLDKNDAAPGNVKAFILALIGLDETQITYEADTYNYTPPDRAPDPAMVAKVTKGAVMSEEHQALEIARTLNDLVQDGQPMRGALIHDTTFRKEIRGGPNAGKPFVGHNWTHYPQSDEEIKARRSALDRIA